MNNTVIGIDIAKNVFQICVMSESRGVVLNKQVRRRHVLEMISKLPKGVVPLESCGGSSYWGREIKKLGLEVRLIPAQHAKPFVKNQKNDFHDAVAICEAALRTSINNCDSIAGSNINSIRLLGSDRQFETTSAKITDFNA